MLFSRCNMLRSTGLIRQLTTSPILVESLGTAPKNADGAKQLYDDWADNYDASLASWDYPAPTRVVETILGPKFEGVKQDSAILDLGCGTGLVGETLRKAGHTGRITGVDISQKSLDLAMEKASVYARCVEASLEDGLQEISTDEFDAAVCVGVLSYVEDFEAFFGGTIRTCRPGALVCVTHRTSLWDDDVRGCQQASRSLEEQGLWELIEVGEPEAYMPKNPDPVESAKTIRILVWRVLAGKE
jgi:SAM-dependent methyltransferase